MVSSRLPLVLLSRTKAAPPRPSRTAEAPPAQGARQEVDPLYEADDWAQGVASAQHDDANYLGGFLRAVDLVRDQSEHLPVDWSVFLYNKELHVFDKETGDTSLTGRLWLSANLALGWTCTEKGSICRSFMQVFNEDAFELITVDGLFENSTFEPMPQNYPQYCQDLIEDQPRMARQEVHH